MKIISVVGAKPNFMKIAPLVHSIKNYNATIKTEDKSIEHVLVHTGQHYDVAMSENFFRDLELPSPNINLEVGSASQAVQTGEILI